MVRPAGFEPAAFSSGGWRSIHWATGAYMEADDSSLKTEPDQGEFNPDVRLSQAEKGNMVQGSPFRVQG